MKALPAADPNFCGDLNPSDLRRDEVDPRFSAFGCKFSSRCEGASNLSAIDALEAGES